MLFRLPKDLMDRVNKAAEACGQTRQAFVQAAVLAEVAEVEERKRMKRLRVSRSSDSLDSVPTTEEASESPPIGTGIAEALRSRREAETPAQPKPQQGQVVVNVGGDGSTGRVGNEVIDRLAAFIAKGSEFDRSSRVRTAMTVLGASAATEEESRTLAARLEEAVAAKTKSSSAGGVAGGIARMAFEKIAGLFGDD